MLYSVLYYSNLPNITEVFRCTAFNPAKPSGHYIYRQFGGHYMYRQFGGQCTTSLTFNSSALHYMYHQFGGHYMYHQLNI
jgi:hypothetical protein